MSGRRGRFVRCGQPQKGLGTPKELYMRTSGWTEISPLGNVHVFDGLRRADVTSHLSFERYENVQCDQSRSF